MQYNKILCFVECVCKFGIGKICDMATRSYVNFGGVRMLIGAYWIEMLPSTVIRLGLRDRRDHSSKKQRRES